MIACICTSRELFVKGCSCGFQKQVKADEERIRQEEVDAAKRRMREIAEWFSPIPEGYAGDRAVCPKCGHEPHVFEGYGCKDPNCLCGSEKI